MNADPRPALVECVGHAAAASCQATPIYRIDYGSKPRYACGRHLSWWLDRLLTPESEHPGMAAATVTKI